MRLFIVRHGIAEDPAIDRPDFERVLTEAGRSRLLLQGRALQRISLELDRLLTSPLVRAVQTAILLGEALKIEAEEELRLSPGVRLADVQEILSEVPAARRVMLVGHQPDLGELVHAYCGAIVKMRKGTIAEIELSRPGAARGILRNLYDPEVLAAFGA